MPKSILIVDDDASLLRWISEVLTQQGYEVKTATDGFLALEELKKFRPDLIIIDVLMPRMDGYQLYKELKNNPRTAPIPVLIQTERKLMEDSFLALGAESFLTKPFSAEDLCEKVDTIFTFAPLLVDDELSETKTHDVPAGGMAGIVPGRAQKKRTFFALRIGLGSIFFVVLLLGLYELSMWLLRETEETGQAAFIAIEAETKRPLSAYAVRKDAPTVTDGIFEEFDAETKMRRIFFYKDGKLQWKKIYNDQGILISEETY